MAKSLSASIHDHISMTNVKLLKLRQHQTVLLQRDPLEPPFLPS